MLHRFTPSLHPCSQWLRSGQAVLITGKWGIEGGGELDALFAFITQIHDGKKLGGAFLQNVPVSV